MEQIIVGLIATLIGAVVFVVDYRWTTKTRKEEGKMNDKIYSGLDELSEALANLGRATSFDGPIGNATIANLGDIRYDTSEHKEKCWDGNGWVALDGSGVQEPINAISCPNCGAPVHGDECEYCGSVFKRKPAKIIAPDTTGHRTVRIFDPDEGCWKYVLEKYQR